MDSKLLDFISTFILKLPVGVPVIEYKFREIVKTLSFRGFCEQ